MPRLPLSLPKLKEPLKTEFKGKNALASVCLLSIIVYLVSKNFGNVFLKESVHQTFGSFGFGLRYVLFFRILWVCSFLSLLSGTQCICNSISIYMYLFPDRTSGNVGSLALISASNLLQITEIQESPDSRCEGIITSLSIQTLPITKNVIQEWDKQMMAKI